MITSLIMLKRQGDLICSSQPISGFGGALHRTRRLRPSESGAGDMLPITATVFTLAGVASATATPAEPAAALWSQNHSSQVKSFASRLVGALPLVASGSEYISDQDVSVLHADTGEPFWSSTAMQEWTYGVALQPLTADPTSSVGLVAFGCPFFASGIPPPCVLGFWKDATKGNLTWKVPLDGATLSASSGPPSVHFSADGLQILAVYTKAGADPSVPPVEYVAVVSSTDGTLVATQRLVGAGTGHGVHVQQPDPLAPPPAVTNALVSLPGSSSSNASAPGRAEFHFALSLDKDGLHPNNTPLIDCNGTSTCAFLAASSDLTLVVVDAVPISNDPPGATQVCSPLPTDAERWGFALYRGDGVSATMPKPYATQWAVCADAHQKPAKERRALNSVSVVANSSRVVAVFSHIIKVRVLEVYPRSFYPRSSSGASLWLKNLTEHLG
jgi:hypothetical protein